MTKPKTPLLSFGARGSVGGSVTFQKRNSATMARQKPIPSQPHTLPQTYHRWDYQDYAAFWHSLTPTEKKEWESDARRQHITGFNYWLRTYLNSLSDLAGRWRLDSVSNAQTPDSSKNTNTGTLFGPQSVPGYIDKGLSFDGVDDYVDCGSDASLKLTEAISVEVWVKTAIPSYDLNKVLLDNSRVIEGYALWRLDTLYRFQFYDNWVGTFNADFPHKNEDFGLWWHIVGTFNGTRIKIYKNAHLEEDNAATELLAGVAPFTIGARAVVHDFNFAGIIDQLPVYNRELTQEDITRHYKRRYPE